MYVHITTRGAFFEGVSIGQTLCPQSIGLVPFQYQTLMYTRAHGLV